jgi:hypothetical protein
MDGWINHAWVGALDVQEPHQDGCCCCCLLVAEGQTGAGCRARAVQCMQVAGSLEELKLGRLVCVCVLLTCA